jgi:hypothetical protein
MAIDNLGRGYHVESFDAALVSRFPVVLEYHYLPARPDGSWTDGPGTTCRHTASSPRASPGNGVADTFFDEQEDQSAVKAAIVVDYFVAWSNIMAKRVSKMAYIDL